jgi:hypothetical protein
VNITKLNLLRESSAFWNNVAASQAHFGSTVPGKKVAASPKVKRILEVLFPEKRRRDVSQAHFGSTVPGKKVTAYRGRALHTHAGPILPFFIFIFRRTVIPFYFGSTNPGKTRA